MLAPLVIPVEQGTRSVIVPQPQPVGGRNTYLIITYITDLPNRTDIAFPFDRTSGLVRLDFLANSVPVRQNITVTTGARRARAACGLRLAARGSRLVARGLWRAACGVWRGGLRLVACGVWRVACRHVACDVCRSRARTWLWCGVSV